MNDETHYQREHWVVTTLRVFLGFFFIYIGGEKFFRLEGFFEDVTNYELVSSPWDLITTFLVPSLEVVAGLALIFHWGYLGALLILNGLLVSFISALSWAWSQGLEISCGCAPWAAEKTTNYPVGIGMNLLLLGLCTILLLRGIKGEPSHRPHPANS